jgi:hypothetical protein
VLVYIESIQAVNAAVGCMVCKVFSSTRWLSNTLDIAGCIAASDTGSLVSRDQSEVAVAAEAQRAAAATSWCMQEAISSERCEEKSAQGKSASSRPACISLMQVPGSHQGVSPPEKHHDGAVEGPEGAGAGMVDVANVAWGGRTRAAARGPPLPAPKRLDASCVMFVRTQNGV